jgi:ribonuclease HI
VTPTDTLQISSVGGHALRAPWSAWQPTDTNDTDDAWYRTTKLPQESEERVAQLQHIIVATDGSYFPHTGQAGASVLLYDNGECIATNHITIKDEEATANMAEVVALRVALAIQTTTPMTIRTDCAAVIKMYETDREPTDNEWARMPYKGLWRAIRALKSERARNNAPAQLVKVAAHLKEGDAGYCPMNAAADIAAN